jgi:hypothetical protein
MIILFVVAAVVVTTPIAAAALVTYASKREESANSLCGRPRSRLEAAARRLLGFQSYGAANKTRPRVAAPRRPGADDNHPDRPLAARKS